VCARYTIRTPADLLAARFGLPQVPDLLPRYHVSPTQSVPVVGTKAGGQARGLALFRWGFIPHWAQGDTGLRPVNDKAETVANSVLWGDSFRRRRCLVPADGFYEWKTVNRKKVPVWFHLTDGQPFAFAGLWDVWAGPQGKVFTVAILTTTPNDLTRPFHDRMPVILKPEDEAVWLDPTGDDPDKLLPLFGPYPADLMPRTRRTRPSTSRRSRGPTASPRRRRPSGRVSFRSRKRHRKALRQNAVLR
jgi:putative SOS response-associated peptidase YedK